MEELRKELGQRGTAEISNGLVTQITQAISESDTEVEFIQFGILKKQGVIPIDQACAKCSFWKGKFDTINVCRQVQAGDAQARGFHKVICPNQLS